MDGLQVRYKQTSVPSMVLKGKKYFSSEYVMFVQKLWATRHVNLFAIDTVSKFPKFHPKVK